MGKEKEREGKNGIEMVSILEETNSQIHLYCHLVVMRERERERERWVKSSKFFFLEYQKKIFIALATFI